MYYVVRTQLYLESSTWSITLSTTRFGLYIGLHQVYLKLIEILYNLYGVLWGGVMRSHFTIVGGMKSEFWAGVF
jgi:hypothetical protein